MLTDEQKLYLEAFIRGVGARSGAAPSLGVATLAAPETVLTGPSSIHVAAQDRAVAAGKKLTAEEEAKRRKDPFAMWDEMAGNGKAGRFPKGTDVFLHKFHGLFYVAPAQNAFMCRLRLPGGILNAYQLRGLADIADRLAGGYCDITTRANLQLREIMPANAPTVLTLIQELGLTSRGSGADNIRNVTGSPTAGIDPQELIDTRPLCREMHHYILNHRELYGLPRKFNIAFDGGGEVGVLEDTNDIGFTAVTGDGFAGVQFRMALGGITGHGTFAADTGVLLAPEECVPMAAAVVRVFIDEGDRTDRTKARLKYVLERLGLDAFMAAAEKLLTFPLRRVPLADCHPRGPRLPGHHLGVRKQRQPGRSYIGVSGSAGRLTSAQMRAVAELAERWGSGTIRLTVWQNLLLSDIADGDLAVVRAALEAVGLSWVPTSIGGSIVACTGNTGCKFSATDTKGHALALGAWLDRRVALDRPINIHLTGCHHSCAQHFVADIGLLGARIGEDGVEGYHVSVGGGAGTEQALAREIYRDVAAADLPLLIERLLRAYLAARRDAESFHDFTRRHEVEALRQLAAAVAAPSEAA